MNRGDFKLQFDRARAFIEKSLEDLFFEITEGSAAVKE